MTRLSRARAALAAHPWWQSLAAGLLAALGTAARLLLPHPVAMANNGDGQRILCQISALAEGPPQANAKWYYIRLRYPDGRPGPQCIHYPTTQLYPVRATAWIHRHLLHLSGALDARELILEYCVLVGLVVAAAAWLLRTVRPAVRIALLAALLLVLTEAVFADYAGSPYSETAALEGLLVVAVAGIAAASHGRARVPAYMAAWAGAVFAVGAKNEMITLLPPLALLLGTRRIDVPRLRGRVGQRVLPALCVFSLAATAAWSLSREPREVQEINFAQEVTLTIMPMVPDPGQVAVDLGLPRSFGQYRGTAWWGPRVIENDPLFARYQNRFTQANLARYLAAHPDIAARVFSGGAGPYFIFRAQNLGSYPLNAGYAPGAQECRQCLLETAVHDLRWTGFPGVLAYWLALAAGGVWLWRTSSPGTRRRAYALVTLTLLGCVLTQYTASVYGDGNEVTKHLIVALFAACLAPVFIAAGAAHPRSERPAAAPGTGTRSGISIGVGSGSGVGLRLPRSRRPDTPALPDRAEVPDAVE